MVLDLKVPFVSNRCQRPIDRRLGWGGNDEVGHRAARSADQMMMMTGEVFRELEVTVLVGDHNAMDDSSSDQLRQVPVRGTLRQERVEGKDLRQGQRMIRLGEHLDDRAP